VILEVRVRGDFDRPRKTLARFARRPDLWRHLRVDVEEWIRALHELAPLAKRPPTVAAARDLLERAKSVNQYPADQRALVHYVVASSLLQRFVATDPPPADADVAEAYYLLGLADTHIGDTYWVSETETYLEAAIRLAPKSPFAEEAYLLLEEQTVVAYTGTAGASVPESVAKHLAELRAMIDR
jgi:hypothetical protein